MTDPQSINRFGIEPKYEKFEHDGKVAVLYSPGYGAGWFTSNSHQPGIVFDREIVAAVLADDIAKALKIARAKYGDINTSGGSTLCVDWVPKGEPFEITEYDGNEDVVIIRDQKYLVA